MSEKGTLYGVGVGPGDPELLTLKGLRILKEAHVIAVPEREGGGTTALDIVREHIDKAKLMYCPSPMTKDPEKLDTVYSETAGRICGLLDEGKDVAFITLGDPTIYSTYIYIHRRVSAAGYKTRLVPGLPSFCAAAARLNISLCDRSERLMIVPGTYDADDTFDIRANKVYMKSGRELSALLRKLKEHGQLDRAAAVENCGMENERVLERLDGTEETGYYCVVIVRDSGDEGG